MSAARSPKGRKRSSAKPPRATAKRGAPRAGASTRGATKRGAAKRGAAKSGAPGRSSKRAKPPSKAAEKAIESRRARHAAASVRKADRPGGQGRRPADEPPRGAGRGRSSAARDRGLGGEQVEGRQAVRELLVAGRRRVREVVIATDREDLQPLQDLADLAMSMGVPVREVTRKRLYADARTEAPQGVMARADDLVEVDLEDLCEAAGRVSPFLVALDGVTDPGNLGALLRSAECAGVTGVVLPRHRAVHVTPTVTKAAAGAIEHLPMAVVGGLPTAIRRMQELGVWVIGLDMAGDQPLFDLPFGPEPVCLVLGAEGTGLSRLVRQRCDALASIPLVGHLASLNVAAAGALACYEVTRRRLVPPPGDTEMRA